MRKIHRAGAAGAIAALTAALAACVGAQPPSAPAPAAAHGPAVAATSPAVPSAPGVVSPASDVFGPACGLLPAAGEGSAAGMADDPVATALSNNPLLSTVAGAIGAVPGLADTLNAQEATTVYAPVDGAFAELRATMGEEAYSALLNDPAALDVLLSHHVAHKRHTAEQLVAAGKTTQLAGGDVTVRGAAAAPALTSAGGTLATVVCGNVATSNATVFLIDKVLQPAG